MVKQFLLFHAPKSISAKLTNVSLFMSLSFAAFNTIWSLYLDSFLNDASQVGFVIGILSIVSLVCFMFFSHVLEKNSRRLIFNQSVFIIILGSLVMYIAPTFSIVFVAAVIYVIARSFHFQSQTILVCDSCKKKDLGKSEGLYNMKRNVGWLLGPLIAGSVSDVFGLRSVFLFASLFVFIGLLLFRMLEVKPCSHKRNRDSTIKNSLKHIRQFFSSKKLVQSYIVSGGIAVYWGIIFAFIPLYIIKVGLDRSWLGIVFFLIAIPLVLFEYPFGKWVDKHGYRRLFVAGHLIMGLASLLAFFAGNVVLSILFIVLGSFGAAMVEGTRESYFFKITKRIEEEKFYGIYRSHVMFFQFIGTTAAAVFLIFFPLESIFMIMGISMLLFAFISLFTKG